MCRRKCVIILLDGLGDRSDPGLEHRTPLQVAQTPNLDRLAGAGACGLFHATHLGQALPSETAHFALFGYPKDEFPGRGPLEALGANLELASEDVAILFRMAEVQATGSGLQVVNRELRSHPEEAEALMEAVGNKIVDDLQFQLVRTHGVAGVLIIRGGASPFVTDTDPMQTGRLLIEPQPWRSHLADPNTQRTARALKTYLRFAQEQLAEHPVNRNRTERREPLANAIVTHRSGRLNAVPTFRARYGLRGLMIASGLVLPGLARYIGMDCHRVTDTSAPDQDLAERITLARQQLDDYDFIHVHTKVPDVAAHTKNPANKIRAIEACDRGIGTAIEALIDDPDVVVVVTADHSTPSNGTMIHSGEPVPLLLHGTGVRRDDVHCFDEVSVAGGALSLVRGPELIYLILNHLDRGKLHGLMDTPDDQPYWPGDSQPWCADKP